MLKLLTDEHVSPAIAVAVKKRRRDANIVSLHDWQDGRFMGIPDVPLLREAYAHGLTLVTFDLRTIPPLLRGWAEQGIDHSGVVFIDHRTYRQNDIGGIAHALSELLDRRADDDWKNRCFFLGSR